MRTVHRLLAFAALGLCTLSTARAAAYTPGHVFVTNRGGNNILELDGSLKLVKTWFATEGLNAPNGMAFDASGNLYVADTFNDRIVVFDKDGVKTKAWSTLADLANWVESINFDKAGRLFASANTGKGRVVSYLPDGTGMTIFVDNPIFISLGNVNFSKAGNVLVSDFSGTRGIRELDPKTGTVLKDFGAGTSRHEDMILDGSDNLFVSAYDANKILRFNAARTLVLEYKPAGLAQPTGIVLTGDCRLLVASYSTDEIFELKWDGTFLKKYAITGMKSPESLAIAGLSVTGAIGLKDPVPVCDGSADAGVDSGTDGAVDGGEDSGGADSGTAGADASDAAAIDADTADGALDTAASADGAGDTKPSAGDTASDSGCGCRTGGASPTGAGLVLLLGLLAARRRHAL